MNCVSDLFLHWKKPPFKRKDDDQGMSGNKCAKLLELETDKQQRATTADSNDGNKQQQLNWRRQRRQQKISVFTLWFTSVIYLEKIQIPDFLGHLGEGCQRFVFWVPRNWPIHQFTTTAQKSPHQKHGKSMLSWGLVHASQQGLHHSSLILLKVQKSSDHMEETN